MESVAITWLLRENEARLLKVKTRCLIVLGFRRARFPYGQHLERRDLRRPRASTIGTGYLRVRSPRTKFMTVTRNLQKYFGLARKYQQREFKTRLELGLVRFKYPLALYPWCQRLFKRGLRFRSSNHPLEKPEVYLSQICLRLKTCRPMTDPEASCGIRGKSFCIQSKNSGVFACSDLT